MTTVIEGVDRTAREHPNFKAGQATGLETGFRYLFGHRDDPSREITVTVLVFDVPRDPLTVSGRRLTLAGNSANAKVVNRAANLAIMRSPNWSNWKNGNWIERGTYPVSPAKITDPTDTKVPPEVRRSTNGDPNRRSPEFTADNVNRPGQVSQPAEAR